MRLYVYKSVISNEIFMQLGKFVSIVNEFIYIKFKQFTFNAYRDIR